MIKKAVLQICNFFHFHISKLATTLFFPNSPVSPRVKSGGSIRQ